MGESYLERLKQSDLVKRPPWLWVTSRELATALRVHVQTLNNWRHRDRGPAPAPHTWFRGRTARYRLDTVLAWATEETGRYKPLHAFSGEWLRDNQGFAEWQDAEAVQRRVQLLMKVGRDYRPRELTRDGREALTLNVSAA